MDVGQTFVGLRVVYPQGSVLGPVLFLVYVNDMPNEIHNIIKLFADDTKLYSTRNSETPL